MRTFVAIEIPPEVKQKLRTEQRSLQQRLAPLDLPPVLRWTNTDNLHLTLRFLGETEEAQRRRIQAGLAEIAAAHRPFTLALSRLGCYRGWNNLRVLWVGIRAETEALQAMQVEVESLARQAGFAAETKRFSPHVTLARSLRNAPPAAMRATSDQLRGAAEQETPRLEIDWTVRDLYFIRSVLGRGGPQYSTLARGPLTPNSQ